MGRFNGTWSPCVASASRTVAWQDAAVFRSVEVPGPSADNCLLLGLQVSEYKLESFSVKSVNCLLFIVHLQFHLSCYVKQPFVYRINH